MHLVRKQREGGYWLVVESARGQNPMRPTLTWDITYPMAMVVRVEGDRWSWADGTLEVVPEGVTLPDAWESEEQGVVYAWIYLGPLDWMQELASPRVDVRVEGEQISVAGHRLSRDEAKLLVREILRGIETVDGVVLGRMWRKLSEETLASARAWLLDQGGGWIVRGRNGPQGHSIIAAPYDGMKASRTFWSSGPNHDVFLLHSMETDPRAGLLMRFPRSRSMAVRSDLNSHACGKDSRQTPHLADGLERQEWPICPDCAKLGPEARQVRLCETSKKKLVEQVS